MTDEDEPGQPAPRIDQGRAFPWDLVTPQRMALIVFGLLALAIAIVAVFAVIGPFNPSDPFTVPRTLAVLLIAALTCLFIAWLDNANAAMLGRGMRHLLSIHRAAVATFVVASTATIGISIFVALAALFSGEIRRGLYALAAIEFLLKLAAVSAIIVLITLRKPSIVRAVPASPPAVDAPPEEVVTVEAEQEDRGRLEFGSLAFAFSLVVIAGLIVPSEDLMRLASMFFGGDKKIEDYLPNRPLVTVEDGLSDQIVEAIEDLPAFSFYLDDLHSEDRRSLTDSMKSQVESVLYDLEIADAKRLGAWPLLEAICRDRQDTMIFSNSDNKVLADHLVYLSTEGLVEYPYGDVNSIKLTQYGFLVMSKYLAANSLAACVIEPQETAEESTALPGPSTSTLRISAIDPSTARQSIDAVPFAQILPLGDGAIYRLSFPSGRYSAELRSLGRADPFLQLFDSTGRLLDENDDGGGTGAFDSRIEFDVPEGEKYYLRASSYDGREGDARLLIEDASATIDRAADVSAMQIVNEVVATPLAGTAVVPRDGVALSFTATTGGTHTFEFAQADGNGGLTDLVAVLFRTEGTQYIQVQSDDDSGGNGLPELTAILEQGEDYILVLRHFSRIFANDASVTITVDPPLATQDEIEAPADPAPLLPPDPSGSGGSRSDPSPQSDQPA